ncbi:ATP-binding protein [Micromonospora sp. WMMD714]|uniref:ATP-binding protein n=1 Tax=Micromonospora sp. WMMD714 TaxID=3016097 RepID=UPI00249C21F6|nr:ATP-binding protein [Micromonospora sp. WMMD714]WFE62159.1 ATP-binding protein [Micromonospora sp. WMMD714]
MSVADRPPARPGSAATVRPAGAGCRVVADDSSALVRLSGELTPTDLDGVRAALLARLVDRPGPIVVDLAGLRGAGPTIGRLLAGVRREVVDWPAAELLVVDPAGAVTGVAAGDLAVFRTADEALAALARKPMAAVLTEEFTPTVGAARRARQLVTEGCDRWGVPELTEPACIAVTELVNNVVAHAGTPMTLRLAPADGALHLAVRDYCPRRPRYAGPAPLTSTGGRGLVLIDTVARRWGSTPLPDGKVIWCVLHAEDESPWYRD